MTKKPIVIAHRGARNIAPENTLESIQAAIDLGVDAVEFDVDLSLDRFAVVVHQETLSLNPTTNCLELAKRDAARAWTQKLTLEQIQKIDAGAWFYKNKSQNQIPTLDQALNLNWKNVQTFVELKEPGFWFKDTYSFEEAKQVTQVTYDSIANFYQSHPNCAIISFNPQIFDLWANLNLRKVLAIWIDQKNNQSEILKLAKSKRLSALTLVENLVLDDPSWCEKAKKIGFEFYVYELSPALEDIQDKQSIDWDLRQKNWKKLVEIGVDGITSDFPKECKDFIDSI